jgi:hypothetical protein
VQSHHAGPGREDKSETPRHVLMEDVEGLWQQLTLEWESISQMFRFVIHHDIPNHLKVIIKER